MAFLGGLTSTVNSSIPLPCARSTSPQDQPLSAVWLPVCASLHSVALCTAVAGGNCAASPLPWATVPGRSCCSLEWHNDHG